MIYFVVAKNNQKTFKEYLMPGLDKHGIKCCVASDDYEGQHQSIFIKYNQSIEALIKNGLKENDIVVFSHEDVKLIDDHLVEKFEMVFEEKKDVGLIGVVGASKLNDTCRWWSNQVQDMRGHIIQENNTQNHHLIKGIVGYSDDLIVVDGLIFAIRADLFLKYNLRFDQENYDGFHFYDIDICCQILEKKLKIAVADILVLHKSIGDVSKNDDWAKNKDVFVKKWTGKYKFPLTSHSFFNSNIKEIEV
jgi:hypothetical protein